jgi:elongation factor Ts
MRWRLFRRYKQRDRNKMNSMVEMIKKLRGETGAGAMECRKALEQGGQNYDQARAYLREQAALKAGKQAKRETLVGKIEVYSHNRGRIGVMVEINTETEFASRSEVLQQFAHEIALQIAAASPLYVRDEDIPQQILAEQAQTAAEKARKAGKTERIIEQIVAGVLERYKSQHVLVRQAYIRDENIAVAQLVSQAIGRLGENIVIRRFIRWEICPDVKSM